MTDIELGKFYGYVVSNGGCWEWMGARVKGYGRMHVVGGKRYRQVSAHRIAYEHFKGVIPDGYQIDHLCRNKACCNPEHLEAVTPGENTRRAIPFQQRHITRIKHECIHGHPLTPDNLYYSGGRRSCKQCQHRRTNKYYFSKGKARRGEQHSPRHN